MSSTSERSTEQKINSATQDFIRARLPDWLTRASVAQIAELRSRFNTHRASQAQLRERTAKLQPLQVFAEQHLQGLLAQPLPSGVSFAQLEWRVVSPGFATTAGHVLPDYSYRETRRNGLLQLMSNFPANSTYYDGTGLVAPGTDRVLSASSATLVDACRTLDVGGKYQTELETVFNTATQVLLADDKRAGFQLAAKIAALRGDIAADTEIALREVADDGEDQLQQGLRGYPGLLEVLGQAVADALLIELKNTAGEARGLVLYLPGDPNKALRFFSSHTAMATAMAENLQDSAYRQFFSQLISLEHRAGFIEKLNQRLSDATPDLQMEGRPQQGSVFTAMASEQVQRVKDDARLLLVPTAEADAAAARARREAWKAAGMSLVNLAGLFIPVVGAILLAQLLVQTLSEVYEGVVDLAEGHQHEALEHLFDVLETVLVAGATVAGGAVLHNAVIDAMEPVSVGAGGQRLWSGDLQPYQTQPEAASLGADGLYADGSQRWMRSGTRYFEVHRPDPDGAYCLRHPLRDEAFAPEVVHNGERSWRLLCEQPLEWEDSAHMLDTLWPQHPAIGAERAEQVLEVAGVDQDELRGILVEHRRAPVNLRETLRRFEQDARVDGFFRHVREGKLPSDDLPLLQWCEQQAGVGSGLANVLANEAGLRGPLLEHLMQLPALQDELLTLLKRDFPWLPDAYARELLPQVSAAQRSEAIAEAKLPVELSRNAASLWRVARLGKARAGLYLNNAYSDETGALVMAVLAEQEPATVRLQLREASASGRLLGGVVATDAEAQLKVLVRDEGRFTAYDREGASLDLAASASTDIFKTIVALLSEEQLAAFGVDDGDDPAGQLRAYVIARVPQSGEGLAQLLGWASQPKWFNPGRRLSDGRVGYLLSGRGQQPRSPRSVLRDGVRRYFPGLEDAQVDQEVERLMQGRATAYEVLDDLADDHQQLQLAVNRWTGSELNDGRRAERRQVADSILRAWRAQGDPVVDAQGLQSGQRLRLVRLNISTLPELPGTVEFAHLTVMVINETLLTQVPAQFLQAFTALRELNLSNNQLLRIPDGIGHLSELRQLRLRHNNIRPDAASLGQLQSLARLTHLDLSYNPLGQYQMRYSRLPHLVQLRLRSCQLGAWPQGIGLCGFLEEADLRDNQLIGVPQEVRDMPYEFRRSIMVDNNSLTSTDLLALHAMDTIVEEQLPEGDEDPSPQTTRSWWIVSDPVTEAARSASWDRLKGATGSADFFTLLGRLIRLVGFAWPQQDMTEQAWSLMTAMDADAGLRDAMFQLAKEQPTDDNAIMDCFSQMLARRLRNEAPGIYVADHGQSLYERGRSLFRLDHVERIARQDVADRNQQRERIDAPGIRLAYRVRLRQWLRLPGQPRAMRSSSLNAVSNERLLAVRRTVRGLETLEALTVYLCQRPFWQGYIREHYLQAFQSLEQRYAERLQVLETQRGTLSDAQYQLATAEMAEEKTVDTQALRLDMTRQYVRGLERGMG